MYVLFININILVIHANFREIYVKN